MAEVAVIRPVAPYQIRNESNFNGVGGNSTATLQLDMSRSIHTLFIMYDGITLANIKAVFLRVEGTTTHEFGSGEQINIRNKYLGKRDALTKKILEIDFSTAGSIGGPRGGNQNLASILGGGLSGPVSVDGIVVSPKNVEVEIHLGDAITNQTVNLTAWTETMPPSPLGGFQKMRRYQESFTGVGRIDFDSIPLSGGLINRIYLHDPNNAISNVGMSINSVEVIQDPPTKLLEQIVHADPLGTRVIQTGLTVIDTAILGIAQYGYITDASRTTSIRLRADVDAASTTQVNTITMFLEMWDVIRRGNT